VADDAQLIDAVLAGNVEAFGALVLRYQDRLYHMVVHVVGCQHQAEDVVQEAFVQALLKLNTFQRHSTFYTWLYRIAFNGAITHRRRQRGELSLDHLYETIGEQSIDDGPEPDSGLLLAENAAQVREALARVTDEHRAVLVLRELEGCCYDTIAQILDIPVGTVRSRLHRARAEMRECLREIMGEETPMPAAAERGA